MRCSGERLLRLADLLTPLLEFADFRPDLPQFARQPDLLCECFGLSQPTQGTFVVAFPLVKDPQGAKVSHPISPVGLCAFGEAADLLSGEFFVPPAQERLDPVVE